MILIPAQAGFLGKRNDILAYMSTVSNQTKLLVIIGVLSVLLATVHHVALSYSLYYVAPRIDMIPHFLGGFVSVLIVLWVVRFMWLGAGIVSPLSDMQVLVIVFFSAAIVGALWEIFEYLAGLRITANYPLDTAKDLIMDMLGGMGVYWVFIHTKFRSMLQ